MRTRARDPATLQVTAGGDSVFSKAEAAAREPPELGEACMRAGRVVVRWALGLCAALALGGGTASAAELHPGEALYAANCAACHDHPDVSRAPAKAALQRMRYQTINFALTKGVMRPQAAGLDDKQRAQLLSWLAGKTDETGDAWTGAMMCKGPRATVDLSGPVTVGTFGFDARNSRTLSARQAGLTKAGLSKLDLAWSLAFPDVTSMRAQPAVVGNNLFAPVAEAGALYAFDISDPAHPCVQWIYRTSGAPMRTGVGYGVTADGRAILATAGQDATLHVIDARTGKGLWTKDLAIYRWSMTTGTPRVLKDRIIVPVSQYEISVAADNATLCCNNHGLVFSLDPATGKEQWRYDTMPEAKPLRDRGDGQMLWGPSGAPIWNSPVVDEARGLIYFGTGEANSPPAHHNTDALIAIRLKDGTEAWSMQATANDIFNSGCGANPAATKLNCVKSHETVYRDVDFGASVILGRLSGGRELLFAGQKSGTVWALEPATGKVAWKLDIGAGSALGGVHWGIALFGDTLYVPISNVGRALPGQTIDPKLTAGLYALDARTGGVKWVYAATPDCANGRDKKAPRCEQRFGFSGAPTVVDGAVIQGSLDGRLFVIDGTTGQELWRYDTLRDFGALNGAGKGGSIDNATIVAAGGTVFVGSGYGMFGQAPGNVLLAFRPK
jgi:polyvinyl alcohol dehydrogenase (cytochrome)